MMSRSRIAEVDVNVQPERSGGIGLGIGEFNPDAFINAGIGYNKFFVQAKR
jgi:hypothetical protein